MSDTLTVEMLVRIANKGKPWDIIEVSRTEARNFLIPKGYARELTREMQLERERKEKKLSENARSLIEESYRIRDLLHGKTIVFELAGSEKKIFWSIGEKEIIDRIARDYGVKLEKKHIKIPTGHHLKDVGTWDIQVHLWPQVYIKMHLEIRTKK